MGEAEINRMKEDIEQRFRDEVEKSRKTILANELIVSKREVQFYFNEIERRMKDAMIREIGSYIIRPYHDDPRDVITEFFLQVGQIKMSYLRYNYKPDLADFMEWYCNSLTITDEITQTKQKRVDSKIRLE